MRDGYPIFSFRSALVCLSESDCFRGLFLRSLRFLFLVTVCSIVFSIVRWMFGSIVNPNPIEKAFLEMISITPRGVWLAVLMGLCLLELCVLRLLDGIPSEWILYYWRGRAKRLAFEYGNQYPSVRTDVDHMVCCDLGALRAWVIATTEERKQKENHDNSENESAFSSGYQKRGVGELKDDFNETEGIPAEEFVYPLYGTERQADFI